MGRRGRKPRVSENNDDAQAKEADEVDMDLESAFEGDVHIAVRFDDKSSGSTMTWTLEPDVRKRFSKIPVSLSDQTVYVDKDDVDAVNLLLRCCKLDSAMSVEAALDEMSAIPEVLVRMGALARKLGVNDLADATTRALVPVVESTSKLSHLASRVYRLSSRLHEMRDAKVSSSGIDMYRAPTLYRLTGSSSTATAGTPTAKKRQRNNKG